MEGIPVTTPTREQVVQWAREAGLQLSINAEAYPSIARQLINFATLARADLEATIAEQAAEIERFRCAVTDRDWFADRLGLVMKERDELRQQLAAEQAYTEQLREALDSIRLKCADQDVIDAYFADSTCCTALSLKHDTTALQEYGAKLVERITQFCVDVVELYDDATMQSDYMIDSSDCHDILIALAPYIADKIRKGEF